MTTGVASRRRGTGLHAIESAGIDELRALQLDRLKRQLQHAYANVPFYRAKCDAAGVAPDDLRTLSDLQHFPFTTKDDFRANYPFGTFAVPRERVARLHASSGTTGQPIVVGYTQDDIDTWADLVARSLHAAGARPGDRIHIAYNYGLFTGGLGCHYGAERLGCTVIPISGGQTERQVRLLVDLEPDLVLATPSYLLALADELDRQGVDPASLKLRTGVAGAEPWSEGMRAEIERRLRIDAVDIYGLTELMGPGIAQECLETKDGPTLWEDHFFPEIVDPDTGAVAADGEGGELILTALTKQAVPVIRYRTRDLTRLLPGTARSMRRLGRITARSDDMLVIRGVNMFPSQIEEQVLAIPALSPHYRIVVRREGALDEVVVEVEGRPGLDDAGSSAAGTALAGRIKSIIGISAAVAVHPPGAVERSGGKAVRVVDHRRLR